MTAAPARLPATRRLARTAGVALLLLGGLVQVQAQERGGLPTGPSTVPPQLPVPTEPAAQEPPDAPPTEPDKVHVRRLSDVVAVREGARAAERVLYYFNPDVLLAQGDHVEQGSGGQSVLTLPGGASMQMFATAHAELALLSPEGDVVRFPLLTRLEVGALERPLDLILPGGTQVHLVNTTMRIEVEPGRLMVRNTGDTVVPVHGDVRLHRSSDEAAVAGVLDLAPGQEVILPLFRVEGGETGTITDLWGLLTVRHHRGLKLEPAGDLLRLQPAPPPDGSAPAAAQNLQLEEASVGGVTTRWLPGSSLVLQNPRHVQPPPAAAAPAPPVPAAAADKPAAPAEAAPPAAEKPAPAPADAGGAPPDQPPSPPKPPEAPKLPAGKESSS